ncbi:MAG: aminotransferase class V-fold PLP-dependent enzyme [Tissierellia bacterium]|nr:aminotransferase class V-fold PLP-dependent enzyme [Tissierellia bacterium]
MTKEKLHFETRAIHEGENIDPVTGALNTPIYQTSTFAFETAKELETEIVDAMSWVPESFLYSRTGNPTTSVLEKKIASLENAEDATVTATGMAAVSTTLMSLLNAGDHCLASDDLFIVTHSLLDDVLRSKGIDVEQIDVTDLSNIEKSIKENTKAIYIEALSNPHLDLADIPAIAEIAKKHNLYFIVDNTFLSPFLLRPLDLGADLVLHSATKYIAGHGDALAGAIAGRKELIDKVRYYNDNLGTAISPFVSWLILRGIRTLHLRMPAHCKNAQAVAEFLESKEEVEFVTYPGLESHPQYETSKKLLTNGCGGMITFRLHGGKEVMEKFVDSVKLAAIAVSLGDVRTLIYPKSSNANIIRFSVGCEATEDIIADLEQAFKQL